MDFTEEINELVDWLSALDWNAVGAFLIQLMALVTGFFTGIVTF